MKNGLHDLPNESDNGKILLRSLLLAIIFFIPIRILIPTFPATSPKKEQAPTRHNMLARSDGGPQDSSSVSGKPGTATNLTCN